MRCTQVSVIIYLSHVVWSLVRQWGMCSVPLWVIREAPNTSLLVHPLHMVLAAVGVSTQHLSTHQTHHGLLTTVTVLWNHYPVRTPVWGGGGGGASSPCHELASFYRRWLKDNPGDNAKFKCHYIVRHISPQRNAYLNADAFFTSSEKSVGSESSSRGELTTGGRVEHVATFASRGWLHQLRSRMETAVWNGNRDQCSMEWRQYQCSMEWGQRTWSMQYGMETVPMQYGMGTEDMINAVWNGDSTKAVWNGDSDQYSMEWGHDQCSMEWRQDDNSQFCKVWYWECDWWYRWIKEGMYGRRQSQILAKIMI